MYESVDVVAHKSRRPAMHHSVTDWSRAMSEALHLSSMWPLAGHPARGDGHTVMVLPGFLGSDNSTIALRGYLRRHGFKVHGWYQGSNTARADQHLGIVRNFLRRSDHLQSPVSLVGHSLGGVVARELARRFPERVRGVISLGSPIASFNGGLAARLHAAVESTRRERPGVDPSIGVNPSGADPRLPPGVPSTSIFSRSDGVVPWQSCLERTSPLTENIEVFGSHLGMVVNLSVLHAVVDRLAQPRDEWQKFTSRPRFAVRYPQRRNGGT